MSKSEVELICELSPMQQAMLFASLYAPGSGVYVIQLSLRLTGRLDIEAFERAWHRMIERHDVLRTGFYWEDLEKPLQVVLREVNLELCRESWRGLEPDAQEERLRAFLDADRETGFDLSELTLTRLTLFELGPDVWHLVWSIHHLLVDGWSVGLLLKELFTCYAAFAAGREPSLPRARSYSGYIAWLQRQDAAAAEAFWRRSLAGLAAPTLMADGDGRGAADFRQTGRRGVQLSPEATASLRKLARHRRLTLNTLVQGAWALVLAQATGSGDVVFGGTVAVRPEDLPGADSMIGLFINTLPVRVEAEPERLLLPWLEELQERQVEARNFRHTPLYEVQTWSGLPAGTALFDSILAFESYPLESSLAELLPELSIGRPVINEITNYPLNLVVYPGAELSLELVYDAGRFDPATALRLLERLNGALQVFPAHVERRLADVPLLLAGERQQLLVEWNDTASVYPREACLPELFAAVARESPDAPALLPAKGEAWSYRQLDEASSGLARHLRSWGVVPETRVALCMERSPELIVSVLAALKAGGAYVPLDASYPDERLAFMLEDAEAPLVLVDEQTRQRLEGMAPLLTVEESLWSGESDAEPVLVPAEGLALVIYTSGSTGRPKGVALTHRGVVRLVRGTTYDRWSPQDRVAHLSNISFDAATLEIWAALLNGAALSIIPRDEALSPDQLAARIRRDGITWTLLTTALFNQVARELPEALAPLRTAMFGGEAADPSAVARMLGGSGPDLLNAYGPAEGATISTWHRVREIVPGAVTVPIGLPVANTSVLVLGLWQHLVPPGVLGELFIGGDGLARGYMNRPDLTAERFTPHPWGAGERLYRTGDLVRQRSDGALEFVGRVDSQVKIRGFRIEPGEIEAVLAAHPAVAACAVLARRDPPAPLRLVAYVVPAVGETPTVTGLREGLKQSLPDSMVPSAWVFLDVLPLTPNGKVDRKALPAPEQAPREAEEYAPPSDPVEELLARIWADVLRRERVGVHHDFFELGGHSLLATQVASRIRSVLGVKLPLRCVFEAPTVAGLARLVRAGLEAEEAPPLVRIAREGDLPLSFAQQRLWFIDQLEPASPLYNLPLTLRVEGPLDGRVLALCLGEIASRHEALRTVFAVKGDSPVQIIQPAAPFALPVVDLSGLPEKKREVLLLAGAEASRPFDLTRGPLLRGLLLRLEEGDHLVAVTLHHIVSDGWSLGILMREAAALYPAFAAGEPSPLPELPVQYADFAVWQSSWLRGEVLEGEIAFWRAELAELPPLLVLPTDRPRPAVQSFRGASRPVRLSAGLTRQVEALATGEGATLFMVLLAGFQALLARYSGQQDLAVGSPVAGRNRSEIGGLIGFFVNMLVLRGDLAGEPSFGELLGRVRETALAGYSHQDLPFEKLVQELVPERSFAHASLVQVILALQNAPVESLEIRDLRLQRVGGVGTTAKFDLVLILEEHDGGLSGMVDYAIDLFDATTIDRLILHYERLLTAAVAMPERIATALPLLSSAERHQALTEWNDTRVPLSRGVLLGDLFAAQAARTPEAPAATFEGETLTYAELDARTDRLARQLRGLGCGPESRVGVALERTLDLLVALLGVLKSGAVYVPLDSQYPRERLAFLLEDSRLAALLSQENLLDRLPVPTGLPVLFPAALPETDSETDEGPLDSPGDHCLAYVLYTSGSTGRPKGAMVTHAGMINHLRAKIADLGLDRHSRIAQTASQSFDISIWQLLAPLLVGGSVHIAGQATAQNPERLLLFVARERITVLEVVPALLGGILDALTASGGMNDLSSLQWMIVTGEACAPDLADRWLALAPNTRLLNAYGPTECSDDVTHYERVVREVTPSAALPIGRPVVNTQIYVLDSAGQPAAQGVPGELFVGGSGVGRGYLGDGARTAQAFLPSPFASQPGQRLYRTGDLARWRTDGQLEFLGRIDHQVKIRGHRIELGEIETVLASQPEVQVAVVTAREDVPGQARLVAYVVPRRDEGLEQGRVGEWKSIYDEVYDTGEHSKHDAGVNLRVWINSYTGAPLPENEIVECFEDTVARILSLHPSRVLEMGCGTGLLLLRIAPHCVAYTGADVSEAALRSLRGRIEERSDLPPVDLLHRPADDFTAIPPGSFDVVVVNEVAQYFPSVEYLVRVVEGAVTATAPGGAVFLGGLRSLPLLEVFHTSIELARSPEDRLLGEIREVARRRLAQDKELAIDPALFETLVQSLPRVAGLSIQLKGGKAHNELTRFRYDVILHVAGEAEPTLPGEPRRVDWEDEWTLGELRQALAEGPDVLAIRGVPNARLLDELAALQRIRDGGGSITAGELRDEISEMTGGVEPADLWDLGARSGREAEVRWSDRPDRLDVLFHCPGTRSPWPFPGNRASGPWSRYVNNPDRGVPDGLSTRLRAFASERLPDWMVPSAWVLLDELPVTPNGKVDRKNLPPPDQQSPRESYQAPRTPVEEVLAGIWAELLGLERVGVADHFFDLGGHSLLATRVMSRLRGAFGVEMSLRDLFEAPYLADLAARVESAQRSGEAAPIPPLVPVPREGPLPLSFAQQRLWFIDQLEPDSPLYNIPAALHIEGPLQAELLAFCLSEIVRRHEALRTVFAVQEGTPVQVIRSPASFRLLMVDLAGLPESTAEALVFDLAGEEARRPFDLARGPLLRAVLLRLADEDHVISLTMHHIVGDGWSMGILVREVAALYAAFSETRPSPLPDLSVQAADFAVWQRSWLRGEVLERALSYWQRQLAGLPPRLELPTDRPRSAARSFRGSSRPLRLPAGLTRRLQALSRRESATLFMVLLAGFQTLLARYSGQDDLAVGSPVAGRNRAEIEGLIGFFVNTLVLRGDISSRPSFRELLGQARETALAAYVHQDVPFDKVVEELAPERSLSHTPLFQVMFGLQNVPAESLEIRDLRLRPLAQDAGARTTAKFDLTLAFEERGDELAGEIEYASDLFDAATIDRLGEHFERLLDGLSERPERPVDDVGLLTSAEALQLAAWNATVRDYPSACVHELFARQAERAPGAVAVVFGDRQLTYGELDRRSRRLAWRLRHLGVGPGSRVGICAERSPEMVAAMLGILAAGGAYVPLDPDYPEERLAFLLDDSGAGVLMAQEHMVGRIPIREGLRIEILASTEEDSDPDPQDLPSVSSDFSSPGDPACVIYTSGSTGRPKGVVVPHRAIVRLVLETDYIQLGPEDRVAQAANSSFDAATFEVWGALLNGGRLVGIEREVTLSPQSTVAALDRGGVTALFLTTALFNQIAREEPGGFAGLRYLLFGGELVDPAAVRAVLRAGPPEHLLHVYGPTEATTFASWHRVETVPSGATVPIGQPLANGTLDVLDRGLNPLPVGVPGELYVGGDGLAHGYHARPELTAERFVPHPLSGAPGARLYRTGDLVRRRPDGAIEFLGRLDHQVKIRGFRIEPGEIEAALMALPGVREAVVMVREDRSEKRLVAYVVGDVAAGGLRRAMSERLPDYMMPAAFVLIDALPLTPNGKVDRKALPAPDQQRSNDSHIAPRTPVEEILASIWAELLGLEQVGVNDHFFEMGGHSLLATQVTSRLRSVFGIEVPLRDLFEAPILADLAARIEAARRAGSGRLLPPLVPVSRDTPLPLSFAQQRLWFIDQLEPDSPLYNVPAALRIEGPLHAGLLAFCLGEIVRRHEALRTVFAVQEGAPLQVIRPATAFPLPLIDLAGLPESAAEVLAFHLAGEEARRPFDLVCGPLLRGVLLRLADEDHVISLTMHHIVSDGWSMGILVREVAALYAAFSEGRPSPLPELPVQAADFAVWQRSCLRGEALESALSYWRQQLEGLPPLLELPTDRPRSAARSFRGASRPLRLPAGLTRRLQVLRDREGMTLFMVLLAGFQALLARYSGQDDLAVGSPVAGRNRIEIEGLIGFFVNTLVLRGDLSDRPSFRELLGRARETALAAYVHQDVPFDKVVVELAPERSLSHAPLFQVMLVLQNVPAESLETRDLRLRPLAASAGARTTAKFDLTLAFEEIGDELAGEIEYASDLFDAATIDRLCEHFERLLDGLSEGPGRPVDDVGLLTSAEALQLAAWNTTARDYPSTCVHELFAWQAERAPGALAVVFGDRELTYGELDRRSRRLAWRLRYLGVGPGSRVGICAERSPEMVVAMLGILAAGGAYVPLDPDYPEERLAFLLDDSGASVLISQEHLVGRIPTHGLRIEILASTEEDSDPDPQDLPSVSSPDDPAYVIYTSGSTGRPKGVVVPHRAIVRLVCGTDYVQLGSEDRVAQVANSSFDATTFEVWGALLNGGRLVGIEREVTLSPQSMVAALERGGVTALFLTSAVFTQIAREEPGGFVGLRYLLVGGDVVDPAAVLAVLRAAPPEHLLNAYGPTETTTFASWHRIETVPLGATVPIGQPLANGTLDVLDRGLNPLPVGVPGELYVGGDGLAHGYHARPELTAERFVPHPLTGAPGARLYRTGDLVRRRPDGAIEFLGRLDYQVKIRGFRIEPGEIEAVLMALPGVREAVVVVREDRSEKRLVAYVVGDVATGDLRRATSERLPDYMLPAAFVLIDALPLTPNGKVDRKALPAPDQQRSNDGHIAPRTPMEEILAGTWAELLGLEQVGGNDHFFDLGGHSLLATQVTSRLRTVFGIEVPLRDLFEAPILADLAARMEAARRAGSGWLIPPLVPVPRDTPLPLSFAQQRLWFIDQLEPDSPLYNVPAALRIEGPLHAGLLAFCLGEIVRRHEALRTVFAVQEGAPLQVIEPAAPFGLPLVDLAGLPEGECESIALSLAGEEAVRPFDLSRGPVLRGVLLRLPDEDHVISLTMHHIVSDGWSIRILVREVADLYAAFSQGRPSPLPELPVQAADFAVWQRSWLRAEALESALSYWRRQLAGLPPRLELPTDRPRSAVQSFRGASRPLRLPAGLTGRLQALSRRESATLFMVLLAGFQALLARYSGQDDLAVGSPVAGRNRAEIEGLIGFFVNTLVLRGDLSDKPSFRQLLGRARETALAAYVHQDVPFDKVVEELAPERSLSHTPLFQVMLALQNVPAESLEIRDLRLLPLAEAAGATMTAKFDLTLDFEERGEELAGEIEYASDLFDAATIDRLCEHFERLLDGLSEGPERPVAALPLLTVDEERQLLVDWNRTARSYFGPWSLHELVAVQAEHTPEATALVVGAERLSYRELTGRARRLAGRLQALGVGPECLVGICLERSADLVVALLATLEAGGAYVPLDPAYPRERLAWILEDARATVLLTRESLARALDLSDLSIPTLFPEGDGPEPAPSAAGPGNLAYVIYTSGSTGRPKGVAIEHRSAATLVHWAREVFAPEDLRGVLAATSISFDLSVFELFVPLSLGGTVILADNALALAGLPAAGEVTLINTVPSAIAELARLEAVPASVRVINLAGEPLQRELVDRLYAGTAAERVLNLYGPSEDTTYSTWVEVPRARSGKPTIGAPLAETRAYVLDQRLRPVPLGVPGELCLSGAGLARGYLGRPELTAERFVPDLLSGAPGGRMYRTGDLARWRAEGEIEFLGRLDHQVKIRGFRIEPGEIEAVLMALPGVREAVVVVREDRSEKRLVAYVVGDVAAGDLRRATSERLPDYMVPALFVLIDALPLTPNGKVDRMALPAPDLRQDESTYVPPSNELEERLAGVWQEVLGLDRVGVHDNFFALGGHSLLATHVISRVREVLGVDMPLRRIFDTPTVRQLAEWLRSDLPAEPNSVNNIPLVLRLTGELSLEALEQSFAEVVHRHAALRTRFALQAGQPVQIIAAPAPLDLRVVDLSDVPDEEREEWALALAQEDACHPFDQRGPLLRLGLLRLTERDHLLVATMHHLVAYGLSVSALLREIEALYPTFLGGELSPFPGLQFRMI